MGAPRQDTSSKQVLSTTETTVEKTVSDDDSLEATYTSLIQQHLSVLCVENATFLAERLVATTKTSNSVYLLAMCYYRGGAVARATRVLEDYHGETQTTPAIQYLLGKCLYEQKKYGAAEEVLLEASRALKQNMAMSTEDSTDDTDQWILSTTPCPIPNGAAGLHLLGNICRNSHRKERAMKYYRMSLQLDPTMWTSYQALVEMGDEADPIEVFGVTPEALIAQQNQDEEEDLGEMPSQSTPMQETALQPMDVATPSTGGSASFLHKTNLFQTGRKQRSSKRSAARPPTQPTTLSMFETPNLTPIPKSQEDDEDKNKSAMPPSSIKLHRAKLVASRLYYPASPETTPGLSETTPSLYLSGIDHQDHTSAKNRVLFANETTTPAANQRNPRKLFPQPPSSSKSKVQQQERRKEAKKEEFDPEETSGVQTILELLCVIGTAYKHQCQYRCREALQTFHALSPQQFETGWVLHQVGRAYFEIADYKNAKRSLELMQQVEPHRMKGLEVLSTVLWHLKKEVELSHLAQCATDFDRMSPEAWCVVGNCFALQKEHETALTFFRRANQLDPSFTYAHTLSGHEYMANEDFENAVACYRDAIRVDERHYNAWYGLGSIYYHQEKYDLAQYHYRRAISINPQSCVLYCHLGMAQHANGMPYEALDTLATAFRLEPRNPNARYQRATIFMALERHHEALEELKLVRDAAPRESSIHFAMGRVLKRIGRPEQAMRCFLTAMDLDPKDNNLIKAAMDKLDEPDVDEEVSAF